MGNKNHNMQKPSLHKFCMRLEPRILSKKLDTGFYWSNCVSAVIQIGVYSGTGTFPLKQSVKFVVREILLVQNRFFFPENTKTHLDNKA